MRPLPTDRIHRIARLFKQDAPSLFIKWKDDVMDARNAIRLRRPLLKRPAPINKMRHFPCGNGRPYQGVDRAPCVADPPRIKGLQEGKRGAKAEAFDKGPPKAN
jgi:hypothetical protein